MLAQGDRPRQLHWYHAGPMLFGDWGTSRLYVLGLAFFHAGHASLWFLLAMSVLLVGVGWAYEIICCHYPEGGGVYSAARHRSHMLGVIGALLLCADYVVTASLSALDAFHYLHVPYPAVWAACGIVAVGIINYFGPTKAGMIALVVAIVTILLSAAIAIAAVPSLPLARLTPATGHFGNWWSQFTALILAISGVEAVANMTGIMVKPVSRTAKLSIYPVLAEIVILNLVLTLAMSAVPDSLLGIGENGAVDHERLEHVRDTMMRVLAEYYVGPTFAAIASFAFAALLLSAVNTAVTDLVSIQFMMAHDKELPRWFGGLNAWGMPVVPLVLGTVVPTVTVLLVPDVGHLADLYAIGVVGAVAINLGACSTNFHMDLRWWERWPMMALAGLMICIWLTIAVEKPWALVFAGSIVVVGLIGRYAAHNTKEIGDWLMQPVGTYLRPEPVEFPVEEAPLIASLAVPHDEPTSTGGLPTRLLVCTHGNVKLVRHAMDQAKFQHAELLVLFVRHIAVSPMAPLEPTNGSNDTAAMQLFAEIRKLANEVGVKVHCLYAISRDVAEAILETAVTHGVNEVILGTPQRGGMWRAMKGDVIQDVAQYLPERIKLVITT